ncbi:MAG: EscU/YscU/HrcU family type III secretion system export apparatus switch protein [Treponema sp.]|nr:EscU/YscU/HrcU family type III secretion system export apparatus switch protein [Treponema sp.]
MKKKKIASAIGYSPGDSAPRLYASGKGRNADQIITVAGEAGIAVIEDAALASLLDTWADSSVKSGDFIPPWCWEAAAKVLAFVLSAENKEHKGY